MAGPAYALSLSEDTVPARGRYRLPALNRVLYVRAGGLTVTSAGRDIAVAADAAWHGAGACEVVADPSGATVLRWELLRTGAAITGAPAGVTVRVLREHPIDLDPRAAYLMRCDRVDFAPGGQALRHRHRGGGIRCLVAGALDVTVGDAPARRMTPGSAWFESGREPVLAVSSKDAPTSFIRVAILPREIRGQSSIMYVDPKDAERGRPRKYTVYVDEPIELA
jgi:quercetin dioxygenase-like cupin family protein